MFRLNEFKRPALHWRVVALHLAVMLLFALLIYTPWARVPFTMLDYSEFLPLLRRSNSFMDGLGNLVSYYRSHGRTSYLAYAQLAANWTLFGARPVAWNMMVFSYMFAAAAAAWFLLVRLGCRYLTATAAASLLIAATPAIPGWQRPSGEPLALLFFCSALLLAHSYSTARQWRTRCVLLLFALLAIGLSKDLLAPIAAVPVIVACFWEDGLRWPRRSPRNVALLSGAVLIAAALAFIIVSAQLGRAPNAYTSGYRLANVSPEWVVTVYLLMLLPATSAFTVPQMVANVALITACVLGWTVRAEQTPGRSRLVRLVSLLGFVLLGALLYAPVAWFSPLYGLPFFLGTVALLAGALARAAQGPHAVRWLVRAAAAIAILIAAGVAFNQSRFEVAERRLDGRISNVLRSAPNLDSVLIAVPAVNPWRWAQQSAVLVRYAHDRGDLANEAVGTRDIDCGSLHADSLPGGRVLLINLREKCQPLPIPAGQLEERYTILQPLPITRVLRAQYVLLGADASESPRPR
jgi:hypothetical protein